MFGLKTQISGSDDSYLCENDHTLAKALEVDEKLMVKRSKRDDNKPKVSSESKFDDAKDKESSNTHTTKVKFTIYGEVWDQGGTIIDDIKDDNYFELEVESGKTPAEVVSLIVTNDIFTKGTGYSEWGCVPHPNDTALHINEFIYEGSTYDSGDEIGEYDEMLYEISEMKINKELEILESTY